MQCLSITLDKDDPFFIGAERHTNGVAELAAQVFASLWVVQSGIQKVHIRCDAMHAGAVADALSKPRVNLTLAKVAVRIRGLVARKVLFDSSHVYGHSDDPWNELADVACDAASRRGAGFACSHLTDTLSLTIATDPDSLRWLGISTLHGKEAAQYLLGLGLVRLDFMHVWRNGFLTVQPDTVCLAMDLPAVITRDASCYNHCSNGLLKVSVNVQSLRGQLKHGGSSGKVKLPFARHEHEDTDPNVSFKG